MQFLSQLAAITFAATDDRMHRCQSTHMLNATAFFVTSYLNLVEKCFDQVKKVYQYRHNFHLDSKIKKSVSGFVKTQTDTERGAGSGSNVLHSSLDSVYQYVVTTYKSYFMQHWQRSKTT